MKSDSKLDAQDDQSQREIHYATKRLNNIANMSREFYWFINIIVVFLYIVYNVHIHVHVWA